MDCECGSGKESQPEFDGHGIYLFRACPKCYEEKISRFRPDILERYECDEPIEDPDI
jgi:hypothetical protein